ncbi:hypothetical protein LI328DRAFT_172160 [Trichoderma asperelloides]|nr:hypothetical protein LI328DRAFT_172160 [Trichoderma asperelloides]
MYFPSTTWTRLFLMVAVVQCLTALFLQTYVLLTVEAHLAPEAVQVRAGHTVPMYGSLFIFGFIYELVMFYDALRLSNMIQVVGLCIYNLLLMMYAAFQPRQIRDALYRLAASLIMGKRPILDPDSNVWHDIEPALIALISVLAIGTAVMCFLAHRLHTEFAWLVYKLINADISMKRRVFVLELHVTLIKFDFFFLLGFLVQSIVDIVIISDPEFGLTIGATFVVLLVAVLSIFFVWSESKIGSAAVICTYFGAAAYLVYKLVILTSEPERSMLTIFGAITLAMLICTIVTAILCLVNYGKGLRTYTNPQGKHSRNASDEAFYMRNTAYGVTPFLPHRMTLE